MSADLAKCITEALSAVLVPCGFTKGPLFLRASADVFHLVQLQGSDTNAHASSRYTINLGVWVPALSAGEKPSLAAAHWRQRLGFLCPEQEDVWWQISAQRNAPAVAREIAERIERCALPRLASLSNSRALLALWRSGTSPGLTKVQASRFTNVLVGAAG